MQTSGHHALSRLIDGAVTVRDLVDETLLVVDADERVADVLAIMQARDFDVIGVDVRGDGGAHHYVRKDDLTEAERLRDVASPVLASDVVERSMPLGALLRRLIDAEMVFVLDRDLVRHIVTRADLARPAVGLMCLAYLHSLEQALLPLAIQRLGSRWTDSLRKDQQERALELYARRRRDNVALGLEHCLYFGGVLTLAVDAPGLLPELETDNVAFNRLGDRLAAMRNDLSHGGTILDRAEPVQALRDFHELKRIVEKAWGLLNEDPDLLESYTATHILTKHGDVLAGPGARPLPLPAPACVLTAWNPGSLTRPDEENERAQQKLVDLVTAAGLPHLLVDGVSPDRLWREPSILVSGVSRDRALSWAHDFGQLAVFELTHDALTVLGTRTRGVVATRPRAG